MIFGHRDREVLQSAWKTIELLRIQLADEQRKLFSVNARLTVLEIVLPSVMARLAMHGQNLNEEIPGMIEALKSSLDGLVGDIPQSREAVREAMEALSTLAEIELKRKFGDS